MPRAGLDRMAVVAAAAALADEKGAGQLTLARLADALGVRPPSLYNHIGGLEGLHRELELLGTREMTATVLRAVAGKAGDDAVFALADAYREFVHRRPGLYEAALLRAPNPSDAEAIAVSDELVNIAVAVLAHYGLHGAEAIHAVRGLRSIMHGFVSLEAVGGFGIPLDLDESFHRLIVSFTAGLRVAQEEPQKASARI